MSNGSDCLLQLDRILGEALAEKVHHHELREEDALRTGWQIMRENALELFPSLKERLWRE